MRASYSPQSELGLGLGDWLHLSVLQRIVLTIVGRV
jgi:hypothetical protein